MRTLLATLLAAVVVSAVASAAVPITPIPDSGSSNATTPSPSTTRRTVSLATLRRQVARALRVTRAAETRARTAVATASRPGPAGPVGFPGETGAPGPVGPTGTDGTAGAPGASPVDGELPRDATVTGAWGVTLRRESAGNYRQVISLPAKAPVALGDENVGFPADTPLSSDELPSRCTGTLAAPTAAPGFVCLYLDPGSVVNVSESTAGPQFENGLSGVALDSAAGAGDANRFGFQIVVTSPTSPKTPATEVRAAGTWAYTAP